MTPEQAGQVMAWVAAGFGREVQPEQAAVWIDALAPYNPRAGKAAAHRAPLELTRFPSLAEFLVLCDEEAATIARIDEEAAVRLALSSGKPVSPDVEDAHARAFAAWHRATLDVVKLGGRHTALCGAIARDNCIEGCDFMLAVRGRFEEIVADEGIHLIPEVVRAIYKCSCRDTGFVDAGQGDNSVKPCQRCNPKGWELWAGGHYGPNHDCDECAERRRRKGRTKEAAK